VPAVSPTVPTSPSPAVPPSPPLRQVLWEHIAARRPDAWLWLGDNVYADQRAAPGKWR
jgi:hypothetical protein